MGLTTAYESQAQVHLSGLCTTNNPQLHMHPKTHPLCLNDVRCLAVISGSNTIHRIPIQMPNSVHLLLSAPASSLHLSHSRIGAPKKT